MSEQQDAPYEQARTVERILQGQPVTDGAGVELTRVIGQPALNSLDPFLLLDVFRSDKPQDYIAGFPAHPHRGFETVTYLLAGKMRHADNAGHEGVIEAGGVQWMTAGRGIVHSEMPEQDDGLLEGFQLWLNLPASHKMTSPAYQEHPPTQIPREQREHAEIAVIAGTTTMGTSGPVVQPLTEPLYIDVHLGVEANFQESLPPLHNAFIYVIDGKVEIISNKRQALLEKGQLGVLSLGSELNVNAGKAAARFLLVAAKPLKEPIARGGPFVMNTREEIQQAFADYEAGRF